VISIELRPHTMELGLSCVFLLAVLKCDFWKNKRPWECEWTRMRGTVSMCGSFLTRVACVCRYPVWGAAGRVWGRCGAA
jgi:hypothetical protein